MLGLEVLYVLEVQNAFGDVNVFLVLPREMLVAVVVSLRSR